MIPVIQWPPRRITANIDNYYESRETSLKPPPLRYIAYDQRRRLPTDGCNNHRLAEEMQLRSRFPLTRRFASKELYTKLETIYESTRLHHTMNHRRSALTDTRHRVQWTSPAALTVPLRQRRSVKRSYGSPEWSPHTNEKQPTGNELPTGNERLWKRWKKPT